MTIWTFSTVMCCQTRTRIEIYDIEEGGYRDTLKMCTQMRMKKIHNKLTLALRINLATPNILDFFFLVVSILVTLCCPLTTPDDFLLPNRNVLRDVLLSVLLTPLPAVDDAATLVEEAAILTATLSSSVLVRLILLVTSGEDWAVDVDGGGIGGEVIDFGATIGLVAFGEDNGGSTPPLPPSATVAAAFLRSAARCKRRLAAGLSRFFPPAAAVGLVPPLLALDEGDSDVRATNLDAAANSSAPSPLNANFPPRLFPNFLRPLPNLGVLRGLLLPPPIRAVAVVDVVTSVRAALPASDAGGVDLILCIIIALPPPLVEEAAASMVAKLAALIVFFLLLFDVVDGGGETASIVPNCTSLTLSATISDEWYISNAACRRLSASEGV